MITPELQALVDAGVIDAGQAQAAMASAPGPDEYMGLARCLNPACDMADTDRPVKFRTTTTRVMAPDLSIVINESKHRELIDEQDICCPECFEACALLDRQPPKYQKLVL